MSQSDKTLQEGLQFISSGAPGITISANENVDDIIGTSLEELADIADKQPVTKASVFDLLFLKIRSFLKGSSIHEIGLKS